jgi:hypothetical protein
MGNKRYVQISSEHRKNHELSSSFNVNVEPPIHNAKSVSVKAFSIPNDFYIVNQYNKILTIYEVYIPASGGVPEFADFNTIEIEEGNYTLDQLIELLQEEFNANSFSFNTESKITYTFRRLSDYKISITGNSGSTAEKYFILHTPLHQREKYISLWYNLGFMKRTQIFYGAVKTLSPVYPYLNEEFTYTPCKAIGVTLTEQSRTIISRHVGYENLPFLLLKSRILSNDMVSTYKNYDTDSVYTHPDHLLLKIPINVSKFSYINYENIGGAIEHDLYGKTISSFDISLLDNNENVLQHDSHQKFVLLLEFETIDEHEQNVKNQHLQLIMDSFRNNHRV